MPPKKPYRVSNPDGAFLQAAFKGNLKKVKFCIEHVPGPPPIPDLEPHRYDINCRWRDGRTPLMMAITGEQPDIADYLIEKGANLNLQDLYGATALIYTAIFNDFATATKLIERGARTDFATENGTNFFDVAKQQGQKDFIDLVQKYEQKKRDCFQKPAIKLKRRPH